MSRRLVTADPLQFHVNFSLTAFSQRLALAKGKTLKKRLSHAEVEGDPLEIGVARHTRERAAS